MPHFPDNILTSLKETIVNVFWKKDDVRGLFRRCDVPSELINAQDWNAYKYHIVSPVLDSLNTVIDGIGPLRRLLQECLKYKDGDHLLWTSDGQKRKREAERCLEHLRLLVKDHDAAIRTEEEAREARIKEIEEQKRGAAFRDKLDAIRNRFYACFQDNNAQKRGYDLEAILYDLFCLFELTPRGPFRRTGEQIDGAFTHRSEHFLLEAKWQQKKTDLSDLRDLDGAVGSSLDNTLGLFLSLNGYSEVALQGYLQGNRPRLICMDADHLIHILEGRMDLTDLIERLKDAAVQKRHIYVPMSDILGGIA
ncbi:hypothetical protein [Gimesia maris]|uniref:hypothetical protein n=1 Tax=Gimesia maris TaxID=122 RepID=UPI0030DAD5A9|tara:strand:- start:180263 stop:181186 length:924 start_codon:yes stop_codon:yes gene_type:complete